MSIVELIYEGVREYRDSLIEMSSEESIGLIEDAGLLTSNIASNECEICKAADFPGQDFSSHGVLGISMGVGYRRGRWLYCCRLHDRFIDEGMERFADETIFTAYRELLRTQILGIIKP